MHLKRWERHGDPGVVERVSTRRPCVVPECDGVVVAKGLCRKHYMQEWRHRPKGKVVQVKIGARVL